MLPVSAFSISINCQSTRTRLYRKYASDLACYVPTNAITMQAIDVINSARVGPSSRGVYSIEAWTQPASLKKRGGDENHAYFRENWGGGRKIKGEERLNYFSTYLL